MNTPATIQIQFSEPETPLPIAVRFATATASRLPGAASVNWNQKPGRFTKVDGSNIRSAEVERFVALIRRVLQKQGMV